MYKLKALVQCKLKCTKSLAYQTMSCCRSAGPVKSWSIHYIKIRRETEFQLDLCFEMVSMNVKVSALQSIETPAPSNPTLSNPALTNPNRINKYTIRNVVN